jgi:hypothetical protein
MYIVLAVLLVSGITIFNQSRDNDFQAQANSSTYNKQKASLRAFFDPAKFDQKLKAYKNAFIKEITALYQNKTFKTADDYIKLRKYFYKRPLVGPAQNFIKLYPATEYNCFFNYSFTVKEIFDCILVKDGVPPTGALKAGFYDTLSSSNPFKSELYQLSEKYSEWFAINVDPVARAVALKNKTI